ncbi:uncharacterized protein TNCV_4333671 [Trichonephila clavipes]|nr:uncharacterized protein TNCV_4333671 [Trichonephila clavipes]
MVSAAVKGWWVYSLDPLPDAVAQYFGCTPSKRQAWFLSDDRPTASRVGLCGGWRHARTKFCRAYGSNAVVPCPKLPSTINAGYLNCNIRPYIPNPLRFFKGHKFGHSQTSCRGQLTSSRCAFVGHSSTDCTLEPKCINCTQSHPSDSKLCPKLKTEIEIQVIKTNRNISYVEARKLIAPQSSQTYAQIANPSTASTTTNRNISSSNQTLSPSTFPMLTALSTMTSPSIPEPTTSTSNSLLSTITSSVSQGLKTSLETDKNITKIVCPPLNLLQPVISVPKPNISSSILQLLNPLHKLRHNSYQPRLLLQLQCHQNHIHLFLCLLVLHSTSNSLLDSVTLSSSNQKIFPSACPMFTSLSTVTSRSIPELTTSTSNSLPSTITSSVSQASKPRKKKRHPKNTAEPNIDKRGIHLNQESQLL